MPRDFHGHTKFTLGIIQKIQKTMWESMEVMVMELGTRGRILKLCVAMTMTVGNTLVKMITSHLKTYMSLAHQNSRGILLGKEKPKKVSERYKVLPREESVTQHTKLVYDFKIRKLKDTMRKFKTKRKICNLHEDIAKSDLSSYINKYRASSQEDAPVEGY